jgi:hypothetical protein
MSQHIGSRIPAPLRFELGAQAPQDIGRAVLLATVDEDGSPRIAVLSCAEVNAPDDEHLMIEVRDGTTTCGNLEAQRKAALWCVLDAAAYTVKGTVKAAEGPANEGWRRFILHIESVWRDFQSSAPMISGPIFRTSK